MSKPLTILFAGTSPFAVPALRALARDPAFRVTHVITQPDRPTGRKQLLTPPAVKVAAEELQLPVVQPERLNIAFAAWSATVDRPDFLVVVSYGQILSQSVLDFPAIAAVNVHASLLPRWRGASPIQQAILAGDAQTGVTVQKMAQQLDAGPVLSQQSTPIAPRETFGTLHDRLAALGAKLLISTLSHPLAPQEQDEAAITLCGKLTREDGVANPQTETAEQIDRTVRALTPWPGVTMHIDGMQMKILATSLAPDPRAHEITCKDNTPLFLVAVQPAGKKPMSGAEWGRGRK